MATRTAAQNNEITNSASSTKKKTTTGAASINRNYDDDPYIQAYREKLKTKNTAGGNADGKVQVLTKSGTRSAAELTFVDADTYKAMYPEYYDASGNTNAGSKRININIGGKPVTVEAGKQSTGKFSLPELSTGKLEFDPKTGMLAYTHKEKELTLTDVRNALKAAPRGTKMYNTEIGRKYLEQQKNGVKDTTDYVSVEDYKALLKDYDEQVKAAQKEADRKKNLDAAEIRKRLDEIDIQISAMQKEGGYNVGAKGQKKAVTESYQTRNDILNQLRMERQSLLTDLQYAEAVKTENTYKALANNADFVTKADEGKRAFESGAMLPEFEQLRKKEIEETGGTVNMDKAFNYWQGPELSKYTEEERNTFYYLYATDEEEAEKYWQYMNRKYAEEEEQRKIKETYDWAVSLGDNNIIPTIAAYGAGLIEGIDYIGDAIDYAAYGRIKPSFDLVDINETMRQAALANVDARFTIAGQEIDANDAVRFLYGTGLSILNSRTLVGALGKYASIPMALSSASSATKSALAKGATDQQAITIGFWNGVAEAAFEEISIEHLLNAPNYATATKRELIRFALEQAAIEASEEFNTTLANTISDAIVMGNLSDYNVSYNEYRASGDSMETARKKAQADWLSGIILDALGGFISGGVMGGVPTAFEIATRSGANQQLKQQAKYLVDTMAKDEKSVENLQKVLDEGLNSEEGSMTRVLAEEIESKQKAGETVGRESYYALTESLIQDGNLEDIRSGMEYLQAVTGMNAEEEISPEAVAALDKVQSGQLLTDKEKATLDSDPLAQQYYEATTGREYKTGEAMTQERYNETLGIKNQEKKAEQTEMGTAEEIREDYSDKYGKELANIMANDVLEGKQDITSYAESYNEVYELAKTGVPLENVQKAMKGSVLTPYQVERAYTFGRGKRAFEQQQYQNNAGKVRAKNPNAGRVTVKSGLSFEQLRSAYGRKFAEATGRKQSEAYKLWDQNVRAIQELAKILRYEIRLTDDGVETDKNGRRVFSGANGQFGSAEPGVIEVSVTAGMVFEDDMGNLANHVMVQTLAHELVHAGRFWAKKDFDALENLVFKYIDKNGGNLRDLIDNQMAIAQENKNPISRDTAAEEVVAQAMTDMLLDERVVKDMAERLSEENPSLIEKIVKVIDNFIARIKAFMKGDSYKEAQLAKIDVNGMLEYAEDLRKAFADMTVAASKNMQAAKEADAMQENEAEDLKFSHRDFSYNAFVNKPDMKLTVISNTYQGKAKDVIAEAKNNALKIGKKDSQTGNPLVYVKDIDRYVMLSSSGLRHGLDARFGINAPVTVKAGEIVENAILVNKLTPKKEIVKESYVLIGAAKNKNNELQIVQFVVNSITDEITSIDVVYSINAKSDNLSIKNKRLGASYSPKLTGNPATLTASAISVSQLLDYVNRYFPDILPEDVLKHYGYTARPDGVIGRSALYQYRNVSEINADIEKNNEERLALQKEQTKLRNQYNSLNNSEEVKDIIERMPENSAGEDAIQKWVNEYKAWEDRTQFAEIKERLDTVSENLSKLDKQFDALHDEREETQEKLDIEKSGLSENDYFVKKAVSEYGYTPYFYDAGYILPDGKRLNFSGEKGKHYGSRGLDHRGIGTIFANTSGGDAMVRFMSYGNIRIMDETPGIDILSGAEPTKEQYAEIRKHIEASRSREYYSVDFTDERGNTIGSLEYEGRVSANKVIADIKEFFETGKVPEQNSEMDINRFLYQQRSSSMPSDIDILIEASEEAESMAFSDKSKFTAEEKTALAGIRTTLKAIKDEREKRLALYRKADELRTQIETEAETKFDKQKVKAIVAEYENGFEPKSGKAKAVIALEKEKLANAIREAMGITGKKQSNEINAIAGEAIDRIVSGDVSFGNSDKYIAGDSITDLAEDLADFIKKNATVDVDAREETAREAIRGAKIHINEDLKADFGSDWNNFRKSAMGYLNFVNDTSARSIDDVYSEYANQFPGFFDTENTDPKSQTEQLLDFMQDTAKYTENAFQYAKEMGYGQEYEDEVFGKMATATINAVSGMDDAKTAEAEARLAGYRSDALSTELIDTRAKIMNYSRDISQKEDDVLKFVSESKKASKTVLKNALKGAKDAEKAKSNALATALRKMRDEKVAEAEARGRERLREYRESRNETAMRDKYKASIARRTKTLTDWMLKNSDKEHVPEILKKQISDLVGNIDQLSGRDTPTIKDRKFLSSLRALSETMEKNVEAIKSDDNENEGVDYYLDVDPAIRDEMKKLVKDITDLVENTGNSFTIRDMTGEQLKSLDHILRAVVHGVRNVNRLYSVGHYATAIEASHDTVTELSEMKAKEKVSGQIKNFFEFDTRTPVYAFEKYGAAGKEIFTSIRRGWAKFSFNIKALQAFVNRTYTKDDAKRYAKERHEVSLSDGHVLNMTMAQFMSFYLTSKRVDASENHLLQGGIKKADITVINEITGLKTVTQDAATYHLTLEDIQAINKVVDSDPRAKEIADKLQHYMATVGARLGNEVSMARFGYNAFGEENYFPIVSDPGNLITLDPAAKENDLFRILNMNFTHSLTPGANNAIIIMDVFDVFTSHMEDMCKYNALALPILDSIKWYNYNDKTTDADGNIDIKNVKKSIAAVYGQGGNSYFINFIKDINGAFNGGRGYGFMNKFVSNAKVAAVAANLRVALLQGTSYWRAGADLDPKYLAAGIAHVAAHPINSVKELKADAAEMLQYSGMAIWKDFGFYDTNIGQSLNQILKHTDSLYDKAIEKSMYLAELGDKITWIKLWYAVKAEQAAKGYTGEELNRMTGDRFDDIIIRTQVVDSTITRSDIMRSKDNAVKMFTSFMSEPMLSLNILANQVDKIVMEVRKGMTYKAAFTKHWKGASVAVAAVITSNIAASIVESLIDALRDDDDDSFLQKYIDALVGESDDSFIKRVYESNLGNDLSIISKIPYLREIPSLILGYDSSNLALTAIEDTTEAVKALMSDSKTDYGKTFAVVKALSSLSGLPISAAVRDAVAFYNTAVQAVGRPDLKFRKTEGKYQQLYYAIDRNDTAKIKEQIKALRDAGTKDSTIKSKITTTYKAEYISATEAQRAEIRKAMYATGIYGSANDVLDVCNKWLKNK